MSDNYDRGWRDGLRLALLRNRNVFAEGLRSPPCQPPVLCTLAGQGVILHYLSALLHQSRGPRSSGLNSNPKGAHHRRARN